MEVDEFVILLTSLTPDEIQNVPFYDEVITKPRNSLRTKNNHLRRSTRKKSHKPIERLLELSPIELIEPLSIETSEQHFSDHSVIEIDSSSPESSSPELVPITIFSPSPDLPVNNKEPVVRERTDYVEQTFDRLTEMRQQVEHSRLLGGDLTDLIPANLEELDFDMEALAAYLGHTSTDSVSGCSSEGDIEINGTI